MNALMQVKKVLRASRSAGASNANVPSVPAPTMRTGPLPFELSLLATELETCEMHKLDSVLFSIGCLGKAGRPLAQHVAQYLNPSILPGRWRREMNRESDTTLNGNLEAYITHIPRTATASLIDIGIEAAAIGKVLTTNAAAGELVFRKAAVWAMGGLQANGASVVPFLNELLGAPALRVDAIMALAWMGEAAKDAVPSLDRIVRTSEKKVSDAALDCLSSIGIVPRTCFPHAVQRLARRGVEGEVWKSVFLKTAKLNDRELIFIVSQLLNAWPDSNMELKLGVAGLLVQLAPELAKPELKQSAQQISAQLGLFLLAESNADLQMTLTLAKQTLDRS